jgi:hypothetical protein
MHARELEVVTPAHSTAAPQAPEGRQGIGVVEAVSAADGGRTWAITVGELQLHASRAASCLLEPAVGDRVWFVAEAETCFVLAVLERAQPETPACINVDASAGLELHSDHHIGIRSDELRVQARTARMVLTECTAVLRSLVTHVTTSTFVAKVIETISDRFTQASKTSYRSVAETDQLQAGIIDHRGQEATHIAGAKLLLNGGEIAKVEAGQIHLG